MGAPPAAAQLPAEREEQEEEEEEEEEKEQGMAVGAIMGPDWANLPWVPLLEALCQLDRPADLMRAGLVCRAWHAASAHNRPWRHLCFRDWRATALPQPEPAASSSSPSSFKVHPLCSLLSSSNQGSHATTRSCMHSWPVSMGRTATSTPGCTTCGRPMRRGSPHTPLASPSSHPQLWCPSMILPSLCSLGSLSLSLSLSLVAIVAHRDGRGSKR